MDPERRQRVEELFHAALEREPSLRQAWLRETCGDDALRREVEELLSHAVRPLTVRAMELKPGQTIDRYRILSRLGAGGMGMVYSAHDSKLGRTVALKFLQEDFTVDPAALERFRREARALSVLNHPNICTIFDIVDVAEGPAGPCIVMEYVEGRTLAQHLPHTGIPVPEALAIARAVASALAAAHKAGIVHRDLKPANIMLRGDGVVRVMDFGLAKVTMGARGELENTRTMVDDGETAPGVILGTGPYMSPEQAEGRAVDARSDIFSFGAMLYEMLAGQRAFQGETLVGIISSVLKDDPPSLREIRPDIPPPLEKIVRRCLAKKREERYGSGTELLAAIGTIEAPPVRVRPGSRRLGWIGAAALMVLAVAVWAGIRQWRARWVYNEAIPEINRLISEEKYIDAYRLGLRARRILPNDAALAETLTKCTLPLALQSEPAGASVYFRPYLEPDAPEEFLGTTPANLHLPRASLRVRMAKEGFEDAEGTLDAGTPSPKLILDARGSRPAGMVSVPGIRQSIGGQSVDVPAFWLDRYEVTNQSFKAFVDGGGYRKPEYWKHPFVKEGREIPWQDAMRLFVDSTGRPGPATWELGSYPEGQANYPVGGVSWYEAAAYAEYAHKSLPSVAHWQRAAGFGYFSEILRLSNFSGQGPAPAGKYRGVGPFGTYDMAGNLKEWCFNAVGPQRPILGGAWNEASYVYRNVDVRDPMERLPVYGFRCAIFRLPPPAAVFAPVQQPFREPDKEKPVDDGTFRAYTNALAYDRTPLDARVERIDDSSEYYRKEKVTYAAAYGDERVLAWLFLPKNAAPPYQTVVYFPTAEATMFRTSDWVGPQKSLLFLIRSGRALLYPVYKGTYERLGEPPAGPNALREQTIQRSKDLGRSIDYLETRAEIDHKRLGYFGISLGGRLGVVFLPVEPRIRTAILAWCGIPTNRQPEGVDPLDFAPRVKIPVLLLEGRQDFIFPYPTSQLPLFRLLGTPANEKRMSVFEVGHIAAFPPEMIRAALEWLDQYLGPVK